MDPQPLRADPRVRVIGTRCWPSRLCRSVCPHCGSVLEYEELALLAGPPGPHVVCPGCLAPALQTEGPIEHAQLTVDLRSEEERRDLMAALIDQLERAQARLVATDSAEPAERAVLTRRIARLQALFARLCAG